MSALSKINKLTFSIGVIDSVTKPVNKIIAQVDKLTNRVKSGMGDMAVGAAGLFAAGASLKSSLAPSIDSIAALGEVQSLGVTKQALEELNYTAHNFATQFGGDSASVIRSAYDIQSAIAGLTGEELSSFTEASGVLAVATKADVSNITSYMGTMYGIFEKTANDMGKSNWVQMVAGQTAAAVQMFKTTGPQMEQAFSRLGSSATAHGVAMNEQMAILGELQATMSGSEAATKYQAFLTGVGKAQQKLGLEFVDSHGKLLPMVEVMQRITDKYGALDTVAKKDLMMQAFGSKQAVAFIDNLIPKTQKLAKNIDALGQQKGMDKAFEMATIIASPWDKLTGSINAATSALGQRFAPVIDPLVNSLANGFAYLVDFSKEFPVLTTVLTTAAASVLGFVAVGSAFTVMMGLAKVASGGLGLSLLSLSSATKVMTAVQWLLNGAMLANPITWVVGLVALLAAVVYKYWTPFKAFFSGFWEGFVHSFAPVIDAFAVLKQALAPVGDMFKAVFDWFASLFTPVQQTKSALAETASVGQSVGLIIGGVFDFLLTPMRLFISVTNWAIESMGGLENISMNLLKGIKTLFSYSPMGLMTKGYGIAFDWFEKKFGGLKDMVAAVKDFFGFDDEQSTVTANKVITQAYLDDTKYQRAVGRSYVQRANESIGTQRFPNVGQEQLTNKSVAASKVVELAQQQNTINAPRIEHLEQSRQTVKNSHLQSYVSNSSQHNSASKSLHIDNVEIKTDQPMTQTFEEMMELSA